MFNDFINGTTTFPQPKQKLSVMQKVVQLRKQCEIQSRKKNVSERPNMGELADVSSESSLSRIIVALIKSFRSKRHQVHSYLALTFYFRLCGKQWLEFSTDSLSDEDILEEKLSTAAF